MVAILYKKNKGVIRYIPSGFLCDLCKASFEFSSYQADGLTEISSKPGFAELNHSFGYGTDCDGESLSITLCEPCLIELCDNNKILIRDGKL